ncbi:RUN domain-containing protein 1-like [Liolophura sinensis]|uniref:RUN domain-containing protein 1-like n=1 Tax=Liolophura sinensis TaxID=3198878 RepID=UPI003158ED04
MMEETMTAITDESYEYDSFDDQNYERPAERWAPLGAAATSPAPSHGEGSMEEADQLQKLEEEQEMLNSSLMALTSHFAQVQFRLKQIVDAEPEDKEALLKDLEEFAFKGIPDMRKCQLDTEELKKELTEQEHESKISQQREKQKELIGQLKTQLEDLELYAYETGEAELPTSKVMEKQRVIIDELKHKMDLDLQHFEKLSPEELRQIVDHAVSQIINPGKVKEKLVEQLKTQIIDLERFIQFLQGEATSPGPLGKDRCACGHGRSARQMAGYCTEGTHKHKSSKSHPNESGSLHHQTMSIMKKALAILQIFAISQLGCGGREFQRNLMKRTAKGNHWGDLRAKLEMAVDSVLRIAKEQDQTPSESDYTSDSEEGPTEVCDPVLTQAVRRDLAMAIKDLMQHGLMEIGQSNTLVPFGCFPSRSAKTTKMMHAWDLLLKYYDMKHGREYNESPARKLSQSFHLDIVGGKPITAKQTMLGTIGSVVTSHTPLKRSEDSQFKAFVCAALNEKKLVTWLRLLYRTQSIIDFYYQDWSYAARTGFEDALKTLDKLNAVTFKLPVDLAVRQFSNIKDAF